jgi:hypothetical protein
MVLRIAVCVFQSKHRDTLALLHQMQSGLVSVNDTDDGKPYTVTPTLHLARLASRGLSAVEKVLI